MTPDLLAYYERELGRLRRDAAGFAAAHPKVAARLRLGPDIGEDPHVERLLQGVAYLTAGVRQTLDDGYADVAAAVLGVLYPHAIAPTPGSGVAQLLLGPAADDLAAGLTLPRGTAVETEPVQGEPCRFRTTAPLTLLPLDVTAARLTPAPAPAPAVSGSAGAAAVLAVRLTSRSPATPIGRLNAGRLRLHLHGPPGVAGRLYEALLKDAVQVAIGTGPTDPGAVPLGPGAITPAGFTADEGLWPEAGAAALGYRVLAEFFAFPKKFLFVDVAIPPAALARLGRTAELYVYLGRAAPELEPAVSADTVRLGCVPLVNLYPKRAEPVRLTGATAAVRLVPDARRPFAHEIYSVDRVSLVSPTGEATPVPPLTAAAPTGGLFWHAHRVPAQAAGGTDAGDRGTEVFLTLADRGGRPAVPPDWTLDAAVTCCNRDLPARLPFGGGQPRLQLPAAGGAVGRVELLAPFTPTVRPDAGPDALWRLVSWLNLNPLSAAGGADGAKALREVLGTVVPPDAAAARELVDGVLDVQGGRATAWAGGAVCRGADLTVTVDPARYAGGGPFLFLTVLDRFFGLYASLNSFTRLTARRAGREGVYHRWPPRTGDRPLI